MRALSLVAAVLLLSKVNAAGIRRDVANTAPHDINAIRNPADVVLQQRVAAPAKLKCSIAPKSAGARNRSMRATPNDAENDAYYGGKFLYWGLRGYQKSWKEIFSITGVDHSFRFDFWNCDSTYAGYVSEAASSKNSQTSLHYGQVRVSGSTSQCLTAIPGSGATPLTSFTVAACVEQDTKAVISQLFVHVNSQINNPALNDYFKWLGGTLKASNNAFNKKLGQQSCTVFDDDVDWVAPTNTTAGHLKTSATLRVGDTSSDQCKHTLTQFTFL